MIWRQCNIMEFELKMQFRPIDTLKQDRFKPYYVTQIGEGRDYPLFYARLY